MTRGEENGARLGGKVQGWPHWTTPKYVLDVVRELGSIYLDPCWNEQAITHPLTKLWDHGLDTEWTAHGAGGLVFVNPPYDQASGFVKKAILEALAGSEIVLLVAARTDTKWAHACFQTAQAVCFWGPGRIKFENPPPGSDGKAPSIPSMFLYWGKNHRGFLQAFRTHGFIVDLDRPRKSFSMQVRP
jgi:DNA N-6-adenine-methyltransferase (Dam).